jgi:Fic family protein
LAHRFVSIHPFGDGNGRTARALATTELWRGGYEMRGFLSLEEHYTANLQAYYESLQMGLPVDFYEGRHNPDHTPWLEYFLATMARAADELRKQAVALYDPDHQPLPPWGTLSRIQQQLLTRLMVRGQNERTSSLEFSPSDVAEWFGVSPSTARDWLDKWRDNHFVQPANPGAQRIRAYSLGEHWKQIVKDAIDSTAVRVT